jgi:hypothetical protein
MPNKKRSVEYLTMVMKLWGKHIAGPILAVVAIGFGIASAVLGSDPTTAAKLVKLSAVLTALIAIFLIFRAQYDAWNETLMELEKERAKNEAAPHIDINVLNIVSRGSLGSGLTDLFFYLDLVLGTPNRVSILNFSLMIFNDTRSSAILALDDVLDWQLVKSTEDALRSFAPCVPLVKELTRPGDSVQGWIHFPLPGGVSESSIQSSGLKINVNCEHGTCYYNLAGAYVRVDPSKGSMRKAPTP